MHRDGSTSLGQQRSNLVQEALASYARAIDVDPVYEKAAKRWQLGAEHGRIETHEAARLLLGINAHHEIREPFVAMLLQLAQGESDIMDQVAGLPPTLLAGPEWLRKRIDGRHTVITASACPFAQPPAQRCRVDVEITDSARTE